MEFFSSLCMFSWLNICALIYINNIIVIVYQVVLAYIGLIVHFKHF